MKRRTRTSAVRAVHITDPDALTPLNGRRLFSTVYDLIPLKEGIRRRRFVTWAGYQSYLRALRHTDTLFAISGQTARDLQQMLHLPADRIVVAPPGIDQPAEDDRQPIRNRPYFLFVGGPNPNKNLAVLLEAMAICRVLPEELVIVGHWLPKQTAVTQDRVQTLGLADRVRHLGFVPAAELWALMKHATALVIPSVDEGFGLPVGEGLAAGTVVVHSRIPVLEETSAGAALTFDPRSADELATCLRSVSGDSRLRLELRARGAKRAHELTWNAAVERTLVIYRAVVSS